MPKGLDESQKKMYSMYTKGEWLVLDNEKQAV